MERIALDVHTHLVPVLADRLSSFSGTAFDSSRGILSLDGHPIGLPALYRPLDLIGWLDDNAIERAFVSAPPPTYRSHLLGEAAEKWSAYLTEGLTVTTERWADRLTVLAHLPSANPEVAQRVAANAIKTGVRHFNLPAEPELGKPLSDAAYEPLWKMLDEAQAFVFVHPAESVDRRLSAFYLSNLLGNPFQTAVAIAHLIFGGVIERFSRIQFCFAHGGGVAAILAGRFEQGFETRRTGIDPAGLRPRDLLRRLSVDCIVHDAAALDAVEAAFGPDKILFGSDWPFPMGLTQPHQQLGTIEVEQRSRIFCANQLR
jgi:aminocarboxymuconate-semialdehyde decarboxylase